MIVVLLGYMGSGKSTVGKQLAKELNLKFYDLDSLIETHQKMMVRDIFEEHGEIFFRKLESQVLQNTLKTKNEMILALGGGTPCYANNMELLKRPGVTSIYLRLSVSELVERLFLERESRPLIKNIPEAELPEFIGKHLFERNMFYNQSDFVVDCNSKEVATVVEEIKNLL